MTNETSADPFAGLFGETPETPETPEAPATETPATEPTPPLPLPPADGLGDPVTEVQVVSCDDLPTLVPRSGSWFVYDLETVPDETRFPRPQTKLPEDRSPSGTALDTLLTKPIANIKPSLERLSMAELTDLRAMEMAGKNRATLLSAIEEEFTKLTGTDDSELQEWRKLAFAPFGLRIVSCGIATHDRVYVVLCKTISDEIKLLSHLWDLIDVYQHRVGYNIKGFDDAVIVARSMVLGLPVRDVVMDRGRYAKESIDLMAILFPSGQPMKLKTLCQQLGIVPPAGYEMSGDQVLDLVDADRWEDLALYSHSDAVIEREVFSRVRNYVAI